MNRLIAVFAALGLVVASNSTSSKMLKKRVDASRCGLTYLRHRFHLWPRGAPRVSYHFQSTILSGAVVALMLAFASAGPARAGCTFDDLLNNLEDAVGAITSAECAAACSNGAGCGAVVAMTGALAGVSASGQGKVDQFCSEARGILSDVNAGHDDAVTVGGLLTTSSVCPQA